MQNLPDPSHHLRIAEIFASIQGESLFAGLPCAFVRLAGCDLRCAWCDTTWARTLDAGTSLALREVTSRVAALGLPLVEVTGGEPLQQPGCVPLLCALLDRRLRVLLETSGAEDVSPVPPGVHVVMDLKAPGSGQAHRNRWENLDVLGEDAEIKIVLSDQRDYDWAREQLESRGIGTRWPVLLSPVPGLLQPQDLAAWMLADRLAARLQLQLHKLLWPAESRGV